MRTRTSTGTWTFRLAAAAVAAAATVPLTAFPAAAAGGAYADWTLPGATGTLTFPGAGLPGPTVATDSNSPQVASGLSAFLNPSTPFAAQYGASRGRRYLALRTAAGGNPSTTTLTFDTAPPAGSWGFALGDVDADHLHIRATGPDGTALTPAELGFRGVFNYCQGAPRPSGCTGAGPFDDLPTWDESNAELVGSGTDTSGASGWLRPTKPVKSLTLEFSVPSGIPIYQLWVATSAVAVDGRVTADGCGLPDRTTLRLLNQDGTPVRDAQGDPVTTVANPDGSYAFGTVAMGRYRVAADVPAGYTATDADRPADARTDDVTGVDFALTCQIVTVPERPVMRQVGPGQPIRIPISTQIDKGRPVTVVTPPAHGTVVQEPDGDLLYTPEKGYGGTDSFTYQGRDANGRTVQESVRVDVTAGPPKPQPKPMPAHPHTRPVPPELADSGPRQATELVLLGSGLIVLGGALMVTARRRGQRR